MRARVFTILATVALLSVIGFVASRALVPRERPAVELQPYSESMFGISAASGGDFYFWEPGEFATADLRIPLGGEDVLLAYPELDGQGDFPFPVDTLVSRIEVFVSAQELRNVRVIRPDGRELVGTEPRFDVQSFEHIYLATVQNPNPGAWRVEVQGHGRLSLSVRAATERKSLPPGTALSLIQLIGFELTELRGRPGHEGFFELQDPPVPGSEHPARVTLSGSFATAELGLLDESGEPLDDFPFVPLEFHGEDAQVPFVVPATPYRVIVRGRDFNGMTYQRLLGNLQGLAPPQ